MRTNVDSLAVEYALEKYPEYLVETSENVIDNLNEESYQESKKDFKAGFERCYSLIKPLLEKAIDALDDLEDLADGYEEIRPELEEFLEKYKS